MTFYKAVTGLAVFVGLVCLSGNSADADQLSLQVAELIRQAGSADEDERRLAILKKLQRAPGIEAQLKADLDNLVLAIERWTDYRRLTYFGGEVSRTMDFDFKIAEESPLYPITCLYRARMLVWITLESGNIIRYEDRRRKFLDKAVKNFQVAKAAFPENRIIRMYLGEPIANEKQYSAPANAPPWAVWQRENLERLTDVIEWWIDNRMQPDGQYGGGWGDDCEMWRWWSAVLIGFDDPKITAAQARFSQALLSQPHMKGGYTSQMTDVEHTAEDSSDAITPMMHLDPENAEWSKRALRLSELMEDLWTGKNQRGFLQFKSTYFTADRVDDNPQRACDTVYHVRAMQPALLLWQRTGDKRLGDLFSAWMDTWVDAALRAERGKPAGIVPSAIHWPHGSVGGLGENWWDPRNHGEPTLYEWPSALSILNDTLLLTWHMTKNEKYLEPLRRMAAIRLEHLHSPPGEQPAPGSQAWCAERLDLLAGTLAKYKMLTGSKEFDQLLAHGHAHSASSPSGIDRAELVSALRDSAQALCVNFPGYTSEVRWTDRVLRFPVLFDAKMLFREAVPGFSQPNPPLIYSTVTGDPSASGYFPMNAVRWLTPPRDIAAMITHCGADRCFAELFHFGDRPRLMSAELYLLSSGSYTLTLATHSDAEGQSTELVRRTIVVDGPITRIEFQLPPHRLVVLRAVRGE